MEKERLLRIRQVEPDKQCTNKCDSNSVNLPKKNSLSNHQCKSNFESITFHWVREGIEL